MAEGVIDFKELERALCEKPVSTFSQRALIRLIFRALSGRAGAAETRVAALIAHWPAEGNKGSRLLLTGAEKSQPSLR
jgi:hypothetical protein